MANLVDAVSEFFLQKQSFASHDHYFRRYTSEVEVVADILAARIRVGSQYDFQIESYIHVILLNYTNYEVLTNTKRLNVKNV